MYRRKQGNQTKIEEQEVKQRAHEVTGADIVVATPGRLKDHLENTKGFGLRGLRFLVSDAQWTLSHALRAAS